MFTLNVDDKTIYLTRGDFASFHVSALDKKTNEEYTFVPGDVVRFTVYGKNNASTIYLQKDFPVTEECTEVQIILNKVDTRFGNVISKPTDYWYEVELNPETIPQTIIGYDEDGAKVLRLFPESDGTKEDEV